MRIILAIPTQGRIALRTPWSVDNRLWIRDLCGSQTRPEWVRTDEMPYFGERGYWRIARSHQEVVITGCVQRFGTVTVARQTSPLQKCDVRCVDATGSDCVCSCGGMNHRGGEGSYAHVGATTLLRRNSSIWRVTRFLDHPATLAS
jgi:hypothetical protein